MHRGCTERYRTRQIRLLRKSRYVHDTPRSEMYYAFRDTRSKYLPKSGAQFDPVSKRIVWHFTLF